MDGPITSPPKRKSLLQRLRLSTWLVVLVATGVMLLVEIPGRRTGPTTYAHGWPWPYLLRDFDWQGYPAHPDQFDSFAQLTDDYYDTRDDDPKEDMRKWHARGRHVWEEYGTNSETEKLLDPWSWNYTEQANFPLCVPDALVALAIVVAMSWAWQLWRRRRPVTRQFRLRTGLFVVAILSIGLGRFMAWRHDLHVERELLQSKVFYEPETNWRKPAWLPESLTKLRPLDGSFDRGVNLDLSVDRVNPAELFKLDCLAGVKRPPDDRLAEPVIEKLAAFSELRWLRIDGDNFTSAGLEPLADVPQLAVLELPNFDCTDATLASIAKVRSLSALSIRCPHVTERGIDELKKLSGLKILRLYGVADERFVERLGELPSLEQLLLERPTTRHLHVVGLKRLREFGTDGKYGDGGELPPAKVESFRLESLPALERLQLTALAARDASLTDVPELHVVRLEYSDVPIGFVHQILRLPKLDRLTLDELELRGADRLAIESCDRLHQLAVGDLNFFSNRSIPLRIENLPHLQTLGVSSSHRATIHVLHLAGLPEVTSFSFDCPLIPALDVRGMPQLESLDCDQNSEPEWDVDQEEFRQAAPHRLRFVGLGQLSRLKKLSIHCALIDPVQVAEIAGMSGIESLDLYGCNLDDADLNRLTALVRLDQLNVMGNNFDDQSIPAAARLPRYLKLQMAEDGMSSAAVARLQTLRPDFPERWSGSTGDSGSLPSLSSEGGRTLTIPAGHFSEQTDLQVLSPTEDQLERLNLGSTRLTDRGMAELAQFSNLKVLDLHATQISDAGLAHLAGLRRLESLDLSFTAITGAGLARLKALSQLTDLDLSGTDVSDDSLASLRYSPHLKRLSLADTRISDAGLAHLKPLSKLQLLNLQATEISDVGLAKLSGLKKLEMLRLRQCNVDAAGIGQLQSLPRLTTLDHAAEPLNPRDTDLFQIMPNSEPH